MRLNTEQKVKLAPFLHQTWGYLAADAGELLIGTSKKQALDIIIELTTDADRPVTIAKMPKEDYKLLCNALQDADTKKWLRKEFHYEVY
jgi:hypothetical protein